MNDDAPYPCRWNALILFAAAQLTAVLDASVGAGFDPVALEVAA